jgi:uncharacterized protein (PEP-CTERM system associated)
MSAAERPPALLRGVAPLVVALLIAVASGGSGGASAQRIDPLREEPQRRPSGAPDADTAERSRGDETERQRARPRKLLPGLSTELLWTDNVLPQTGEKQSDFVLTITPRVLLNYNTDRARLNGSVAVPTVLYAETRSRDAVYPEVDLLGQLELLNRFFFVEAAANVRTTFLTPFGARPADLSTIVADRFTTQTYSVSPFIEGRSGAISYLLRDDNVWTLFDDAPVRTRDAYTNRLTGTIEREPTPFGWAADFLRTAYEFRDQTRTQSLELARVRGLWQPGPQLRLHVSVGYERNQLAVSKTDGAIYGAGVRWRPSDRTVLDASWEHRFFGGSYDFLFEHRMTRSSFSLSASRKLTSYPEQLATFPPGSFVPGVLERIFASRIPDLDARRDFVDQFIRERGLPLVVSEPIAVNVQQVYLAESARASAGLLGVRNNLLLSVYYYKTSPVGEEVGGLPIDVLARAQTKQIGASASWTSQLSPVTSLSLTGNASRAEARPALTGTSDNWYTELRLTRRLSPRSTAYAGARYESFDSDAGRDYTATSVFVGAQIWFY